MAIACGVDFGTSNSTVGWVRPGHPTMLALEDGKTTLPSVVFYNAEDEEVTFGRAALAEYLAGYEGRLMRSLKSLLGTSLIDGQTEVGGRALPFRMLLANFIGELKKRAEQASGRPFTSAVFGRPVHFIDDNAANDQLAEDTLAEIARSVGFKDIAFQFEPIAAAFDYESQIDREELVLIADIGGGTSDFSLVRLSPERAKKAERRDDILATGGVHIGGTDFDKYLSLSAVMPLLGYGSQLNNNSEVPSSYFFNLATWHTINLAYTKKMWSQLSELVRDAREQDKLGRLQRLIDERAGHWLAMKVEEGKIALSGAEQVALELERLSPPVTLDLSRSGFDAAIGHLVGSVELTVQKMLADAGVKPEQVDTVFFTGGSSGVLSLRERIGAVLPAARKVEGDLFGSIGAGLALDAVRKFGGA
ncbi:heat-shock protein [Massilia sp. Root418]|uniref:Hsp70 family protein n=1 Tax=Massilia sp. Root418 TaxID=1736532 RepID=UPI0006FC5191|nr:Hsp70 family protein [Massilia sp. Root418]KQX01275.1 heat-shock protein [Massilia sp. Root418]